MGNKIPFFISKNLYENLTSPFKVGRYHSLMAERETLPATLHIEAENANKILWVLVMTLPIYGVLSRINNDTYGNQLIQNFYGNKRKVMILKIALKN